MTASLDNDGAARRLLMWRTESLFQDPERRRCAREWTHLRFSRLPYAREPGVVVSDLSGRMPFANGGFEAVYAFHIHEHLGPDDGLRVLRDMHRVLTPGGVCRVSTPDLAFYAEEYLLGLRALGANAGEREAVIHEWALLNLIDQTARRTPGGKMAEALAAGRVDADHLRHLNGDSLATMFSSRASKPPSRRPRTLDGAPATDPRFIVSSLAANAARRLIHRLSPGLFLRWSFENNRWLYDLPSLTRTMELAGFRDVRAHIWATSDIPGWARYDFDRSPLGDYALEPSLYVEGMK